MNKLRKLLLLTEVFPPAFNPRMGYLVKYMKEYGWEVVVVTENIAKEGNFGYLSNIENIHRVDIKNTSTPKNLVQKLWRLLNKYRHFRNNRKPFTKAVYNNYCCDDFSLVMVSVSWNLFVLEAGYEISKKWNLPFVVDLRDMFEQSNGYQIKNSNIIFSYIENKFNSKVLNLRNKLLLSANQTISVSDFHVSELKKINFNSNLILNGFDDEIFFSDRKRTDIFKIVYAGIMTTEADRNPSILFQAIYKLLNNKPEVAESLKIIFYTPQYCRQTIYDNKYFNLIEKCVEFHNFIAYNEVPELLNNASIGLVLTNEPKNNGPKGILTTKFFEYLGAEIPVLCVKSDEGLLAKCINEIGIGCSAKTVDEAYNFILEKWYEWKEKGYTSVNIDRESKYKFTRRYQAQQFISIFENILN